MKTFILSIIITLGLFQGASAQKQYLKMVDEVGQILAVNDLSKPNSVLPIIFAKLEKNYKLVERHQQIDNTIVELIQKRRKYQASGDTKNLTNRVFDHVIAGILLAGNNSPLKADNPACKGAKMELARALEKYDLALKAYQKCLNQASFSFAVEIQTLDGYLGGTMSDNEMAANSDCPSQRKELKRAVDEVDRCIVVAAQACK